MNTFTASQFLLRLILALLLVVITINPTQYHVVNWLMQGDLGAVHGLVAIALLIGWVIFIRASVRSLGAVGVALLLAFFGFLLWLLIDINWLNLDNTAGMIWILDGISALILAIGVSWSHIRRRISGQIDTDDVDD